MTNLTTVLASQRILDSVIEAYVPGPCMMRRVPERAQGKRSEAARLTQACARPASAWPLHRREGADSAKSGTPQILGVAI